MRFPDSSLTGNNGASLGNKVELDDDNLSLNESNKSNKLENAEAIRTRLLFGGFYNYQITSNLRQSNTLLFGSGNNKQGIRLISDLRYHFKNGPSHHQFTVGMGVTAVNRAYANSYFGIKDDRVKVQNLITPINITYVSTNPDGTVSSTTESTPINLGLAIPNSSTNKDFIPRAGIKDVHADIFWNWSLSSSWLVTSKLSVSHLVGSSSKSPLVERKTNVTVSSAIAYRF
jgi:outer membrane scaffolding protein for murein synthesis (MipA/OmpV family)